MSPAASGVTAPVTETTVRAHVGGSVSGQMAVGDHINQFGSVYGDVILPQQRRPTVEPRLRPLDRPPSAFPNLLGRDTEVSSAVARLREQRGTGFHGERGVGKSSLLRHVANHPDARATPDGVLYCPGRGQPLADLLQSVFDGFYDAEMGYTPNPGQVRHYLGSLKALLVIDDVELGDRDLGVLADTLPRCTFLLTSDRRCMWEPGRSVVLRGLPEPAALSLLERELDRKLAPDEAEAARALWQALDGNPRSLVQAAAVVADEGRSLAQVAAATAAGPPDETMARQAVSALTERERDLLALVAAVAPAPLHVDRAAAITGSSDCRVPLEALLAKGLVTAHSPRYSLTVELPPEEQAGRDRWAEVALDHYVATLDAGRRRPDRFGEDVDAIRALAAWAVARRRWGDVVRLVRVADPVLAVSRRWEARDQLVRLALTAARAIGDRAAAAWCHHQLGTRALWLGAAESARHELTQAVEIRRSLGDQRGADVTQFHLDQLGGGPPPDEPAPRPNDRPSPPSRVRRPPVPVMVAVCLVALLGVASLVARSGTDDESVAIVPIGSTTVGVEPSTLSFEKRPVGRASSPKTVTLTNRGELPFTARGVSVEGDDYTVATNGCGAPVEADGSCQLAVTFTPSLAGDRLAVLVVDTGEGRVRVPLTGEGAAAGDSGPVSTLTSTTAPTTTVPEPVRVGSLQADRSELAFGGVLVGRSGAAAGFKVSNVGSAPVRVTSVTVSGPAAPDFRVSSRCPSEPLTPAGSCDLSVSFTPGALGERTATVAVAAEGAPPVSIRLTGSGIAAQLRLEPPSATFPNQPVGSQSAPYAFTVRNTGTAAGTITGIVLQSKEFIVKDACTGDTLDPGRSCTFHVYFMPRTAGPFQARLEVRPDSGPVASSALTGTGVEVQVQVGPGVLSGDSPPPKQTQPAQTGLR